MPTDHAEAAQLIAVFSDALRTGQNRLADRQLGRLSDMLVEAIAEDELSIQRLLKTGLNEAHILFSERTSLTGIAPGDARMLGMIEVLGGMANTAVFRSGSLTVKVASANTLGEDDTASLGMRR